MPSKNERFDIAARQRAEQQQLQQFVVGQSIGAGVAKTAAQAFAMAVIMRRGVRKPAIALAFLFQDELRTLICRQPAPRPWSRMTGPGNFAIGFTAARGRITDAAQNFCGQPACRFH